MPPLEEDKNSNDNTQNNSITMNRIKTLLEAYRQITTDYNSIINSLNNFRGEISELKDDYKKEYTEVITSIAEMETSLTDNLNKNEDNIKKISQSMDIINGKITIIIENLTSYNDGIGESIKKSKESIEVLVEEFKDKMLEEMQLIKKWQDSRANVPSDLETLLGDLKKRGTWKVRLQWMIGTIVVVIGILETLTQLNIINISWFK